MEPSSPKHEPEEAPLPMSRMMGGQRAAARSSISGLKPFLLVGVLVVIGLLVSLGALLRRSDRVDGAFTEQVREEERLGEGPAGEPTPGAMTIGRPTEAASGDPAAPAMDGQPVSPSEFTFYETLKKPPQDPAATVGLAPAPKPAAASKPAAAKPAAQSGSRVIDTAEAGASALRYTVQVGAFRQQPVAEQMIATLNRKGHDAYLMVAQLPDGVTYRVRVGKFATREEANRAAKGLAAKEGLHPFVATIQPNS
ncbi:MAG: SPOR domain-containing protein [Nitrospirota bacterium]